MSISYEYYKIFYYVARYHSFNRAAKVLMNSQPNISRAMNNLEGELGCLLFERSHRGVTLTAEGEALFSYVEKAHKELETGEEQLRIVRDKLQDSVTLGLSVGITDHTTRIRILPAIRAFSRENPDIKLRLVNDSTPSLIRQIDAGEIDIAIITTNEYGDSSLRENIICKVTEIPIAGNSFRDALYGRTVSLRELADYPLITLARDTETFAFHDQLFARHGVILKPYIETHTMRQALAFVESNMGIGCIADEYAQPVIDRGLIFRVEIMEGFPNREIALIKNKNNRSTASRNLENCMMQVEEDRYVETYP